MGIYQRIFALGIKKLCKQANEKCEQFGEKVFSQYLSQDARKSKFGYASLRKITGSSSKLMESVHYSLHNGSIQALTVAEKIKEFKSLLETDTFTFALPSFLLTGYVVPYLKTMLASTWKVNFRWVGQVIRGWRHAVDEFLPPHFQVQDIPEHFVALKNDIVARLKDEEMLGKFPDILKILGTLQKHHVLHYLLVKNTPVAHLLDASLGPQVTLLQDYLSRKTSSFKHHFTSSLSLSTAEFQEAAAQERKRVSEVMKKLASEGKDVSRIRAFMTACDLLHDNNVVVSPYLIRMHPTSRYLRGLARLIQSLLPGRKRRILGALGAIIARACASKHPEALVAITSHLAPEFLMTAPYTSKKRKRDLVPLELIMNKEFLLYRTGNYEELTNELISKIIAWKEYPTSRPGMSFTLPKKHVRHAWQQFKNKKTESIFQDEWVNSLFSRKLEMIAP